MRRRQLPMLSGPFDYDTPSSIDDGVEPVFLTGPEWGQPGINDLGGVIIDDEVLRDGVIILNETSVRKAALKPAPKREPKKGEPDYIPYEDEIKDRWGHVGPFRRRPPGWKPKAAPKRETAPFPPVTPATKGEKKEPVKVSLMPTPGSLLNTHAERMVGEVIWQAMEFI